MVQIPRVNGLLAALPRMVQEQFIARCDKVELVLAQVLCKPGDLIHHVYFPTESYISLISQIDQHSNLEIALVGNEGMHGIAPALGVNVSMLYVLVQGAGTALRMKTSVFRQELLRKPLLQKIINHYIFVRLSQIAQAAACTRFHVVEARMARWLLMTQDRAFSNKLNITQEFLAYMLGVRRVGITEAASSLQKRQLIVYKRGTITIINRMGLEAASCGCYQTDRETYDRTMN